MTTEAPAAARAARWGKLVPDRRTAGQIGACAALLVLFAVLSFTAIRGKSATYDEPLHAVGGYMKRHFADFRINPEDPSLFGFWSAIPHGPAALQVDVTSADFVQVATDIRTQWPFVISTLYHTPTRGGEVRSPTFGRFQRDPAAPERGDEVKPGRVIGAVDGQTIDVKDEGRFIPLVGDGQPVQINQMLGVVIDADGFINRSRMMFTLLGVGLGALICWWAWRLAGAVAATVATALFALDPNFLAHASLVKNDVALSLLMLALGYTLWQFGRRATWWRLIVLGAVCAIAVNVKFSAILFAPMTVLLLVARAALPAPWRAFGLELRTVWWRLAVVPVTCAALALIAWAGTWAVYGFRYAPMTDGALFDSSMMVREARARELQIRLERLPSVEEFEAYGPSGTVRAILWMMDSHVLPQGWLFGFLYTYATTLTRGSFLMGQYSNTGWWYYFPLAVLFKTPLATLAAALLAMAIGLGRLFVPKMRAWRVAPGESQDENTTDGGRFLRLGGLDVWVTLCLLVPPLFYGLAALTTNLNLGLRHVLPVYPYVFIGIGIVAAVMFRRWTKWPAIVGGALALGLAVESLAAYPNFLPFFNTASGGSRGGLRFLGDSNLDWGQDLPLLAKWQKSHRDRPLFLAYFGTADPEYYGVNYLNLPAGGYAWNQQKHQVDRSGYIAVSATYLQGIYIGDFYKVLRENEAPAPGSQPAKLLDALGETIYVYEWEMPPVTPPPR